MTIWPGLAIRLKLFETLVSRSGQSLLQVNSRHPLMQVITME